MQSMSLHLCHSFHSLPCAHVHWIVEVKAPLCTYTEQLWSQLSVTHPVRYFIPSRTQLATVPSVVSTLDGPLSHRERVGSDSQAPSCVRVHVKSVSSQRKCENTGCYSWAHLYIRLSSWYAVQTYVHGSGTWLKQPYELHTRCRRVSLDWHRQQQTPGAWMRGWPAK